MRKLWNDWMTEGDKPLTATGNLKRLSIPLVIGWEHFPEEMVHKCRFSNQIDRLEDDDLYEDFLGEGVAETVDVVDNMRFHTKTGPAFSWMMRIIAILRDINHIKRQKTLKKLATQYFRSRSQHIHAQGKNSRLKNVYWLICLIWRFLWYY